MREADGVPPPPTGAYNAAVDLIGRNLRAGRGDKPAFIDETGTHTYADLAARADRFANLLRARGIRREERVVLALLDTIDFPAAFLGAIKAGVVPVPVNTLLKPADYAYILRDSRARMLVVSAPLWPSFAPVADQALGGVDVVAAGGEAGGHPRLDDLLAAQPATAEAADTVADEVAFWLYSSGSTGMPKGAMHVQSSLIGTADLYAGPVLGIREDDLVFSAAKLFFAYGLGNGLTFPMAVGATTILHPGRPTPDAVWGIIREKRPTIFYGVPTLYAALLASPDRPGPGGTALRVCASAGEALPADIGRRWTELTGTEILDGIGSTEMLHIFLSNAPGKVRYGTTGTAVPGYGLRLVGDDGREVARGEVGELQIRGPTAAAGYWNNRAKTRGTFLGEWTRSGDKYMQDADGYYVYCGRTDDMLKVGGIYVSPFEVEGALLGHDAVLEAAVVGAEDGSGLVKPRAFVVLKDGRRPSAALDADLKAHVKDRLAPYKYPRWIEFVDELPKTATGKIQRFRLRELPPPGDAAA